MEESGDQLSSLPNEILQHIISKLPFKEAVQSGLLSTSWRKLMTPSRVNIQSHEEAKQILESLSESGDTSFQTLKLHLDSSDAPPPFAVFTKGVHGELHLDFSAHPPRNNFNLIFEQSRPSFASRVKVLHLRSVSYLVGEMVSDLCSNCSVLESLKIEKCDGLENIDVGLSKSLRNFEMVDCPNIVGLVVSAENLRNFSYKGVLPVLELVQVPNLVDATLDFRDGIGNSAFDCEDALCLLSSFKDVETLTITSWFIEALCCGGVIFNKLDFQFSRLKELKLISSKISTKTRDSCSCFLHITPSLEELSIKIDQTSNSVEYPTFNHQHWHEPHLWKDYVAVKSEACFLKHMKKIKVDGFTMERDELLWMDLLLHTAVNLKEMILDDSWRVAKIPYSQLSYLRLKYFLVFCPEIDSFFVLIEH